MGRRVTRGSVPSHQAPPCTRRWALLPDNNTSSKSTPLWDIRPVSFWGVKGPVQVNGKPSILLKSIPYPPAGITCVRVCVHVRTRACVCPHTRTGYPVSLRSLPPTPPLLTARTALDPPGWAGRSAGRHRSDDAVGT